MKPLFIAHHSDDDAEVDLIFDELRLRGVRSWVDHRNGFYLCDSQASTAHRVITRECSGFLLYARQRDGTCPALDSSPFIRNVEIPAAFEAANTDHSYLLAAIPVGLSFGDLRNLTVDLIGKDLSSFNSIQGVDASNLPIRAAQYGREFARLLLARAHARSKPKRRVLLSFFTHDERPPLPDDDLSLDWSGAIDHLGCRPLFESSRLVRALVDVRLEIARQFGHTVIRVRGTLHLSVAVAVGRVFVGPSRLHIEMEQNNCFWTTSCAGKGRSFFDFVSEDGAADSRELYVGVSATRHDVRPAIRDYVSRTAKQPREFLWFHPKNGFRDIAVSDNATSCDAARQVGETVAQRAARLRSQRVHLFMAVPQTLAMMIGRSMNACPTLHTYEFLGGQYYPSLILTDVLLEPEASNR